MRHSDGFNHFVLSLSDHFVVFFQFGFHLLLYFKPNDINPQTNEVSQ